MRMGGRYGWRRVGSVSQKLFDRVSERRNAIGDDLPRQIEVDVEVSVNQNVTEARNTSPIDLREPCAQV
jgi:hypothetical protein